MSRRLVMLAVTLGLAAGSLQAQTTARDPWVRATVPGQQATGLFVELRSPTDARLVGGTSPVANSVEIHEMRMDNGVMRMRAVPALPLPAGQSVKLSPGGYHLMLTGLKQPLKAGDTLAVTLTIERDGSKTETLDVRAPVRLLPADAR
ncbi:MAG: copper chaperone PCu(A)C [Burkholderiales bacterium]|uniref:copper chaperone PCu(A)C n=1 Tax=Roseateles sp. TaxID=1971397 RepID=UPI000FB4215F|nr:MAG: copper chaperone PCu(A)C [Burkholderiales bacterium]